MENRERDRVSQRTEPTEAGLKNRETSERLGREVNEGSTAEFGQSIGRSENLREGGEMQNKDKRNMEIESETNRRSGSEGYGSSTGRSSGSMSGGSDVSRETGRGEIGSSVRSGSNRDESSGRH